MDSANKGYWGRGTRRSGGLKILSAGMFATLLTLSFSPPSYSSSVYSGSSVGTNGTVYGWGVTDAPPPPGFAMVHTAYVRTTLTSPNGRTAYSGTRTGPDTVRADVSLGYDPSDLGTYSLQSTHGAWCPVWQRWIIPLWVPKTSSSKTVPYVVIWMRNTFGQSVSTDNAARNNYYNYNGTYAIGTFQNYNNSFWQTSVEIVGTVYPTDYSGTITLHRQIVNLREYYNSTIATRAYPPCPNPSCDDTSPSVYRDDNPLPNGRVYDTDNPGLAPLATENTFDRVRVNFREYAVAAGVTGQVSANFYWWSRLSVWRPSGQPTTVLKTDVPGDNTSGLLTTPLSWDLQ